MPHRPAIALATAVFVILASQAGAVSNAEFEALVKQADRDKATKAGWNYAVEVFSKTFAQRVGPAMGTCATQPDTVEPATLVFIVAADGKVTRAVASPGIPYGECIVSKLRLPFTAPRPPHGNFAVAMGAANHHNEETKSKAPPDKPVSVKGGAAVAYDKAIQPYIAKARATYPGARKRFLAGLPPGWKFAVSYRLLQEDKASKESRFEDVIVDIDRIKGGTIYGRIANKLNIVTNYRYDQAISFPESKIMNWLFVRPDGSEEGNILGNFLDHYKPR
jgi:uncharacterized protein YegJ (DUF2314 family)